MKSKLQSEIALSTCESECIALSSALREVLPMIELAKELSSFVTLHGSKPKFNVTVHEDNKSCIAVAESNKPPLRTKHIAVKYHHFRNHINKSIFLKCIDTHDQVADIFTKPVDPGTFFRLRKILCGW